MAEAMTEAEVLARMERLRKEHNLSWEAAAAVVSALRLNDLFCLDRESPHGTYAGVKVLEDTVTVATAGDPKRGPKTGIVLGFETVIRMRHHTTSTGRLGYVAFSESNIRLGSSKRKELMSNDSIEVGVPDWFDIWFDSDTAGTVFELWTEYRI